MSHNISTANRQKDLQDLTNEWANDISGMKGGLDTAGQTASGLALLSSGPGRGQQGPPYRLQLIRARLQATERTDKSLAKILYQKVVVWRPLTHTFALRTAHQSRQGKTKPEQLAAWMLRWPMWRCRDGMLVFARHDGCCSLRSRPDAACITQQKTPVHEQKPLTCHSHILP